MGERLRICFAAQSASRAGGGITFAMVGLASALCRRGHSVRIVAFEDAHAPADRHLWTGMEVSLARSLLGSRRPYNPNLERLLNDPSDIIHLHGLWTQFSAASTNAAARLAIPRVVSPHGMLEEWALRQSRLKKLVALRLFERNSMESACVHALTDNEAAQVRRLGVTSPICVIPNGVDPQENQERRAPWPGDLPDDAFKLLFIGRIHPKKGLPTLLAALAYAMARQRKVHLLIAGPDEIGHRQELETKAVELGIHDHVHFLGPLFGDQKLAALHACDAFVLPSLSEGLPMAVLEAWSAGVPVLMTRECNLQTAFTFGAAVELPQGEREMGGALARFLDLPESERRKLGIQGREYSRQNHSWDGIAGRFEAVYRWLRHEAPQPDFVIGRVSERHQSRGLRK